MYDGEIIAYIILGQMKRDQDFSSVQQRIAHLPLDFEQMRQKYECLLQFNPERINSVASVAEMLAKMILLEHILRPSTSKILESAETFIAENFGKPMSIEMLTKNIGVSKSVLYREFHERHNCTVNEYVNRYRIEKSIDLLLNTDLPIEVISQRVGFASAAYYTVNFKREKGTAPLKFRKNARDNG